LSCHSERSEESDARKERGCHVILSGAKNLGPASDRPGSHEILRSAQNDRRAALRMTSQWACFIVHRYGAFATMGSKCTAGVVSFNSRFFGEEAKDDQNRMHKQLNRQFRRICKPVTPIKRCISAFFMRPSCDHQKNLLVKAWACPAQKPGGAAEHAGRGKPTPLRVSPRGWRAGCNPTLTDRHC